MNAIDAYIVIVETVIAELTALMAMPIERDIVPRAIYFHPRERIPPLVTISNRTE
jgi:hypothetical protein